MRLRLRTAASCRTARAVLLSVMMPLAVGTCASPPEQRPSVTARDPSLTPYASTGWHVTVFYLESSERYGATMTDGGDYILQFGADGVTVARVGESLLVGTSADSSYYYEVDARVASDRYRLPTPDEVRAVLGYLGGGATPMARELERFATVFAGGPATVTSVRALGEQLEVKGTRVADARPFWVALLRVDEVSFDPPRSRQRVDVADAQVAALLTGER